MELNNYRSVTPLRKRRKKITASAALVLCVLCLIIGILCGRAASSNKQAQEAAEEIARIEQDSEIEISRLKKEIDTYKKEINKVKQDLAAANKRQPMITITRNMIKRVLPNPPEVFFSSLTGSGEVSLTAAGSSSSISSASASA